VEILLWAVTPSVLQDGYQYLKESSVFRFSMEDQFWRCKQEIPPKHWFPSTKLRGSTTKKITFPQ